MSKPWPRHKSLTQVTSEAPMTSRGKKKKKYKKTGKGKELGGWEKKGLSGQLLHKRLAKKKKVRRRKRVGVQLQSE